MPQTYENTQDYQSPINRSSSNNQAIKHQEGPLTKMLEHQTAKIPSGVFLGLAVGSMATSFGLALVQGKSKGWANFIAQWAPTLLILGLYNKLVKVEGSDQIEGSYH